ncbi:MAG: FAD-binding oxidoreductase [Gammaproteobacteria bacterium]|nr:FAD-binding oxidoreductase [Gammaproteobacteria bacterium]
MPKIIFRNKKHECRDNETVLDALQRQGVEMSFSCRKGSCQTCVLKCVSGQLPEESQNNLRPALVNNGYFMPCVCKPSGDMEIMDVAHDDLYFSAPVISKELLSDNVCRLLIEAESLTNYRPGQFINLSRPQDGLTRSYSIANRVDDYFIEIHVQRMANGLLSNWIFDELVEGEIIDVQGPNGSCIYSDDVLDKPLLMISSGTGLAPHLGIVRDAIDHHHKHNIYIYHGSNFATDAYLHSYMTQLASEHPNINYYSCIKTGDVPCEMYSGEAVKLATLYHTDIKSYQVFVAGSPSMVESVRSDLMFRGVPVKSIHADPFDVKDLRQPVSKADVVLERRLDEKSMSCPMAEEVEYPEPDPEMWAALEYGRKLNLILADFYDLVYEDSRLAPFFENTTKQRSIEKQYSFLRRIFSGEKVYFGDRPRNAHHWMVISDDLFDYRESIMMTCLRRYELPEKLIERWFMMENSFRPDMVKNKPWNKIVNGVEFPVDGYEEAVIDIGSLCDSCQQEIDAGTKVRFHVRLGLTYCPSCTETFEHSV